MTRTPHFDYSSTKGIFNISIRPECLSLSVLKDFISSLETTYLKTISNLTVYPEVIKQSEDMFRDNGRYIKDEDLKEGQDPYLDWRAPDGFWRSPEHQQSYTDPRVSYRGARESILHQGEILKEIEDKILFFKSHYADIKSPKY